MGGSGGGSYKMMEAEAWKGGEDALRLRRLQVAFDKKDIDSSGYLDRAEIVQALVKSGVVFSEVCFVSFDLIFLMLWCVVCVCVLLLTIVTL